MPGSHVSMRTPQIKIDVVLVAVSLVQLKRSVDLAHGLVRVASSYHQRDIALAAALRDGDDVDSRVAQRAKDAC